MINEEVLGGLISGLERGESLKKAMITLFNAGYKKEEIEEAAGMVNQLGIQSKTIAPQAIAEKSVIPIIDPNEVLNQSQVNPQTFESPLRPMSTKPGSIPQSTNSSEIKGPDSHLEPRLTSSSTKRLTPNSKSVQKVSNYVDRNSKEKLMIFLLVALLVFLVGVLVAIFLFKDELVNFFSTFFV